MKLYSLYFKESEFICKCGKCKVVPGLLEENVQKLANVLDVIRYYAGPIIVNSGIRCKEHNKKVGGVSNSKHLLGQASDIRSTEMNVIGLWDLIERLEKQKKIKIGYKQLYKKKGFIHIDIRGIK